MARTYKHFKKHEEIFLGMSLITLLKVAFVTLLLLGVTFSLKLSLNSPLFLLFAIFWMIVVAFIVKAASGTEVKGFYTSFILHPFQNHIFPLYNSKEKISEPILDELPEWRRSKNPFKRPLQEHEAELNFSENDFNSLSEMQSLKTIKEDFVINKSGDLISYIKLDNGVSLLNLGDDARRKLIDFWGRFLTQFQSITSMKSYFLTTNSPGDSVQAFIWAKPFKANASEAKIAELDFNLKYSELINQEWYQGIFNGDTFIPDLEFYLIIKHKRAKTKIHPAYALAKKLFPGWLPADLSVMPAEEFEEEYNLLKQKIEVAKTTLASMDIKSELMTGDVLKEFCLHFMPLKALLRSSLNANTPLSIEEVPKLEDKAKYISFGDKFYKTYRVANSPDEGDLDFWVLNYLSNLDSESYVSIHWTPRDGLSDRRKAESKVDIMTQIAKSNKSSTMAIIKENKAIADELVACPFSFDLSIFITVVTDDLDKLQKIDNKIRRPVHNAMLAPLDRQQVKNWLSALPFADNKLNNEELIFACKDFAQSCFPFLDSELGTKEGPLVGLSLQNMKPIYLDEYDRSLCNNRGINFIGDSGSGKTVSAKLAVKRRMHKGGSFIIVDNTSDGWKFFLDYYGGTIVDIDTSISPDARPFFAPFALNRDENGHYSVNDLNLQIEKISKLLSLIKERGKVTMALEEVFLFKSIQRLYKEFENPCLSDLYCLWTDYDFENKELAKEWAEIIAPYCRCTDGIYSGLMDGTEARVSSEAKLLLFTFSKVDSNSNFLPVSLYLVSNYVGQRVMLKGETQVTFIVDEAWKMFSGANASKGKELLTYFARAGRGMDLGLWTISQKPMDLPREIHSSASCTFTFQLKESQDRREMASLASFSETDRNFLENPDMSEPGTAFLKTTRASGLIKVALDPFEEILCNSTRDFVNKRSEIFTSKLKEYQYEYLSNNALEFIDTETLRALAQKAAFSCVEELLNQNLLGVEQ